MWWDNQFNLREHGDLYEKLWWPMLSGEFPQYERLWTKHIVPLTNRIDPSITRTDEKWTAFRRDPKIDEDIEHLAMQQYSIFYFLARATLITHFEPHMFIEDAFIFLDAAASNLLGLLRSWRNLTRKLSLPHQLSVREYFGKEEIHRIRQYGNAYQHSPRIGRAHDLPLDHVPIWIPDDGDPEHAKWEKSWRYVQSLGPESFEEGRKMTQGMRLVLIRNLRKIWNGIDNGLTSKRNALAGCGKRIVSDSMVM